MENQTPRIALQAAEVFYKASSALITEDFVEIGKTHLPTHLLAGVSVRRRSGLYFGWLAFLIFLFLIYGGLHFRQFDPWGFSFTFLSRSWDCALLLFGVSVLMLILRFALFPPFALYLEIAEDGNEKEISVRTSLKPQELRKMAEAIEKAMNWDYSPMKTF